MIVHAVLSNWDVNNTEELKTILHSCGAYDVANSLNNLAY